MIKATTEEVAELSASRGDLDDVLLEGCLHDTGGRPFETKQRRPDYKFHKKPPRRKGTRGRQYNQDSEIASAAHVKGMRGNMTNGMLGSAS